MTDKTLPFQNGSDRGPPADAGQAQTAAFSKLRRAIVENLLELNSEMSDQSEMDGARERIVRAHLSRISRILEVSSDDSTDNVYQTNPGGVLDLDAARAEIDRRLAQLSGASGD